MSENAAPTAIGKFAFAGTSITEITIPESVKRIDRYAFPDTLENAYFESVENWYYTRFSGSSVSSSKLTDSKKAAEYVLNLGDYDMYVKE